MIENNQGAHSKERFGWHQLSMIHKLFFVWFLLGSSLVIWDVVFAAYPFFVSPVCYQTFLWPAIVFGLAISIDFITLIPIMSAQPGSLGKFREMHPFYKYVVMPVVAAIFLGYLPLAMGLPILLNCIVGKPYQNTYTVSRTVYEDSASRGYRCNHVFINELDRFSFGRLCVSETALHALKPGDRIYLEGTQSWFGIRVDKYSY